MKTKDDFLFNRLPAVILLTSCFFIFYVAMVVRPVTLHGYSSLGQLEVAFENAVAFKLPTISVDKQSSYIVIPYKRLAKRKVSKKTRITKKHLKIVKSIKKGNYNPVILTVRKYKDIVVPRLKINIKADKKFIKFLTSYKRPNDKKKMVAKVIKRAKRSIVKTTKKIELPIAKTTPIRSKSILTIRPNKIATNEIVVEDNISQKLAAPIHTQDDDLIMYSYKPTVNIVTKSQEILLPVKTQSIATISKKEISSAVSSVITRVSGGSEAPQDNLTSHVTNHRSARSAVREESNKPLLNSQTVAMKSIFANMPNNSGDAFSIKVRIIGDKSIDLQSSIRPGTGEYVNVENNNQVNFYSESSKLSGMLEVSFRAEDCVDTIIDLKTSEIENVTYDIPMFKYSRIAKYLSRENALDQVSYLLVEHSFDGQGVDVDSGYEKVVYLDKDFKPSETDISYELFIGVEPGIRTLSYMSNDKKDFEIIYMAQEGVMNFKKLYSQSSKEINLAFREGQFGSEVNINDQITVNYLNQKIHTYQDGKWLNLLLPAKNRWMRDYLSINRGQEVFYIGIDRSKAERNISLLSEFMINKLYDFAEIEDSNKGCIVQVNLDEKIDELSVTAKDTIRNYHGSLMYLDDDGEFYEEKSDSSKFAFFLSNQESAITFYAKNIDDKQRVSTSFCKPGTYIIEVL